MSETNEKTEVVTVPKLRTRCCECQYPMLIGRSISMQMGMNSGHVTCPKCKEFLHVEQLEGDEVSTERWTDYSKRMEVVDA